MGLPFDPVIDLNANTEFVVRTISGFDSLLLNTKPNPETWSLAQCLVHLIKIDQYIMSGLSGTLRPRDTDAGKILYIKKVVLTRTAKVKAPPPINPEERIFDVEKQLARFQQQRSGLIELAEKLRWQHECEDIQHFLFGKLTTAEWVYFSIYHAERHIFQMHEIASQLYETRRMGKTA